MVREGARQQLLFTAKTNSTLLFSAGLGSVKRESVVALGIWRQIRGSCI